MNKEQPNPLLLSGPNFIVRVLHRADGGVSVDILDRRAVFDFGISQDDAIVHGVEADASDTFSDKKIERLNPDAFKRSA